MGGGRYIHLLGHSGFRSLYNMTTYFLHIALKGTGSLSNQMDSVPSQNPHPPPRGTFPLQETVLYLKEWNIQENIESEESSNKKKSLTLGEIIKPVEFVPIFRKNHSASIYLKKEIRFLIVW